MQQLLPNQKFISTLKNKTLFFYFFKIKKGDNKGVTIQKQFAQHQAKCLHWFNCEYIFIGDESDCWTHAAIFEFPNSIAAKKAIEKGMSSQEVEALQAFAVRPTTPPKLLLFLFKLLRPIGTLYNRGTKKITVNEVIETFESERDIVPNKNQITRHLQNTRTSKAYMINLLQSYPKAKYDHGNSIVSGATAYYKRYGLPALRSVLMQGGDLILAGRMGEPIIEVNAPKATQGSWEGIGIMEYPNPSNLFSLKKMPGYKKALTHRRAGLERTALIISKKI